MSAADGSVNWVELPLAPPGYQPSVRNCRSSAAPPAAVGVAIDVPAMLSNAEAGLAH